MLPQPHGVIHGEPRLLVTSAVPGLEALPALPVLAPLGYLTLLSATGLLLLRQQTLAIAMSLHQPAPALPQLLPILIIRAIHHAAIQKVSDLIHLLSIAEGAGQLWRGHGPDKVHASLIVFGEEGIIVRNLDGEALGVENKLTDRGGAVLFAALDTRGVLIREPESETVSCVIISQSEAVITHDTTNKRP